MSLRFNKSVCLIFVVVAFVLTGYAEDRNYILGTSINLTGGGTNRLSSEASTGQGSAQQPLFLYYGAFPELSLTSKGSRSTFNGTYSYGVDWSKASQKFGVQSHNGGLNFSTPLSEDLTISFTDSFLSTNSSAKFNASRGVATDPNAPFVFFPEAFQISTRANSAAFSVAYKATDRSSVTFTLSDLTRNYSGVSGTATTALSNQNRYSGEFSYGYQSGKDENWKIGYTAAYLSFRNFGNAYLQSPRVSYSNQIVPGVTLNLSAGLSQVTSQGPTGSSYLGYDSGASLRKSFGNNSSVSLNFSQMSADTSGLGSVSSTWRTGLSFNRATRDATMMVDASYFDTKGTLDNVYSAKGVTLMASAGHPLSSQWSVQVTGQYQRYSDTSLFGFQDRRFFVGLRYSNPSIWKGTR
jgi:hypothetical protein